MKKEKPRFKKPITKKEKEALKIFLESLKPKKKDENNEANG